MTSTTSRAFSIHRLFVELIDSVCVSNSDNMIVNTLFHRSPYLEVVLLII